MLALVRPGYFSAYQTRGSPSRNRRTEVLGESYLRRYFRTKECIGTVKEGHKKNGPPRSGEPHKRTAPDASSPQHQPSPSERATHHHHVPRRHPHRDHRTCRVDSRARALLGSVSHPAGGAPRLRPRERQHRRSLARTPRRASPKVSSGRQEAPRPRARKAREALQASEAREALQAREA